MQLPTRLDLYETGRRYIVQRSKKIDGSQVDVAGSDANLYVGSQSFVGHAVVRQLGERVNTLLLDGCYGEDLDRYAFDRYQMTRKGASPALGTVEFTRPTAALGAGNIPAGTKVTSLDGIEFITTADAPFFAGSLKTQANVRSAQAGKRFQVGANQIRRFARQDLVFDQTITLNNPERTAGGEDREEDDVFKERVRDFFNTARRGTLKAIEFGAKTVPGVESAQATEELDANARPARFVKLFVADSSGVASAALVAQVMVVQEEYRAAGIFLEGITSQPQIVSVRLKLTFIAGVDTVTLGDDIRNSAVSFVNSLGVNQPLLMNDLGAVLSRFREDGLIPDQSTVVVPVGDIVPTRGFTIRTTKENVTVE